MGSKNRIAKHILPIILKDRVIGQWYVEPFVGGANLIDKVNGNRIGADNNKYLIAMWKGLQETREIPDIDITKDVYSQARAEFNNSTNNDFSDFMIGWIGWMGSANGRFFDGGYSGKSNTKIGTVRDYISESIRNISKQINNINGIDFYNSCYQNLFIPRNSVIYCDIPYKNTKQYAGSKDFDYDCFWDWCRNISQAGHQIYISEYSAPDDFKCVWEIEVKSSLSANGVCGGSLSSIERLFTPCL
jgi:DNA adenine methylase